MESRDILDTEQTKCTESYNHTTYSQYHAGAVLGSFVLLTKNQLSTSVCFMVVLRAKTKLSGPSCLVYGFYGEND